MRPILGSRREPIEAHRGRVGPSSARGEPVLLARCPSVLAVIPAVPPLADEGARRDSTGTTVRRRYHRCRSSGRSATVTATVVVDGTATRADPIADGSRQTPQTKRSGCAASGPDSAASRRCLDHAHRASAAAIRFEAGLASIGTAPIEVRPDNRRPCPAGKRHSSQIIYRDVDGNRPIPALGSTRSSPGTPRVHGLSPHAQPLALSRLLRATRSTRQRRPDNAIKHARKMSFCLRDSKRVPAGLGTFNSALYYRECRRNTPQGISRGLGRRVRVLPRGQSIAIPPRVNKVPSAWPSGSTRSIDCSKRRDQQPIRAGFPHSRARTISTCDKPLQVSLDRVGAPTLERVASSEPALAARRVRRRRCASHASVASTDQSSSTGLVYEIRGSRRSESVDGLIAVEVGRECVSLGRCGDHVADRLVRDAPAACIALQGSKHRQADAGPVDGLHRPAERR